MLLRLPKIEPPGPGNVFSYSNIAYGSFAFHYFKFYYEVELCRTKYVPPIVALVADGSHWLL